MPLISSGRLRPDDLVAWEERERRDCVPLGDRVARAQAVIRRWLEVAESPHVACSWGKDSVVCAHLTRMVSPSVPVVWVRLPVADNPDCEAVRDAYLSDWPTPYREVWADPPDLSGGHLPTGARRSGYRRVTGARVTGIRAEESGTRARSARVHGLTTARVCRPILHWTGREVFSYLRLHDLPVHPAYAMSMGGALPRERLRVASIGGLRGRKVGREQWERAYYGDVLARVQAGSSSQASES